MLPYTVGPLRISKNRLLTRTHSEITGRRLLREIDDQGSGRLNKAK